MRRRVVAAGLALLLSGCAVDPAPPLGAAFDPAGFFDGSARSRGTITTALVRREDFTAGFSGHRKAGALLLDERFHFADGERLQRWRLRPQGDGGYGGTVETEGASGRPHPPVPVTGHLGRQGLELSYDGYAPGGDTLLHFRHRMTPRADGTILNRVRISKFGLPVAGADVVFERVPTATK